MSVSEGLTRCPVLSLRAFKCGSGIAVGNCQDNLQYKKDLCVRMIMMTLEYSKILLLWENRPIGKGTEHFAIIRLRPTSPIGHQTLWWSCISFLEDVEHLQVSRPA